MLELYQPIVNFGVLVVISAMYLYQTPKTIEKVTKVIESNTNVIKDTQTYHENMEKYLESIKQDIERIKETQNCDEIMEALDRLERKFDQLVK